MLGQGHYIPYGTPFMTCTLCELQLISLMVIC